MLQKRVIIAETPKHELRIRAFFNSIKCSKVKIRKELFSRMCEESCRNFDKKYCCPPYAPRFEEFVRSYDRLLVVLFTLSLNQLNGFNYLDYHKLRIANIVLKSRIERFMRCLDEVFKTRFLSTGACRLCKPCKCKIGEPCKHPNKMRYSLESVGVDCDYLSRELFNIPLLWYEDKKAPEYTSVICAIPIKENKDAVVEEGVKTLEKMFKIV